MTGDNTETQLNLFESKRDPLSKRAKNFLHKKRVNLLSKRTYAFAFDAFSIFFISKSLMFSYFKFISPFFYQIPVKTQTKFFGMYDDFYLSLFVLTYLGYFTTSMLLTHGQTPGKMLFALRVVCPEDGVKGPRAMKVIIRSLSYLFCHLAGVILLAIPYFNQESKGIPDWLSQTHVKTEEEFHLWLNQMNFYNNSLDEWNATQLPMIYDGFLQPIYSPLPKHHAPTVDSADEKIAA